MLLNRAYMKPEEAPHRPSISAFNLHDGSETPMQDLKLSALYSRDADWVSHSLVCFCIAALLQNEIAIAKLDIFSMELLIESNCCIIRRDREAIHNPLRIEGGVADDVPYAGVFAEVVVQTMGKLLIGIFQSPTARAGSSNCQRDDESQDKKMSQRGHRRFADAPCRCL